MERGREDERDEDDRIEVGDNTVHFKG